MQQKWREKLEVLKSRSCDRRRIRHPATVRPTRAAEVETCVDGKGTEHSEQAFTRNGRHRSSLQKLVRIRC